MKGDGDMRWREGVTVKKENGEWILRNQEESMHIAKKDCQIVEIMVTREDSMHTYEYEKHFIIYPNYNWWGSKDVIPGGKRVDSDFEYSSGTNTEWLTVEDIKRLLRTDLDQY